MIKSYHQEKEDSDTKLFQLLSFILTSVQFVSPKNHYEEPQEINLSKSL